MSVDTPLSMALLAIAWLGYFVVHSALASRAVKHWVEGHAAGLFPAYRIGYNVVAFALLVPIVYAVLGHRGPLLWAWNGPARWLAHALELAALAALMVTFRYYDGGEFFGVRQWAARHRYAGSACPAPRLRLSPLHRYVRHPWYSAALVLVWTRDMDAAFLVSAFMVSAYFFVGAKLEDAKLVAEYGAVYRRYVSRVGGLVPWPGRTLSAREAAELEAAALEAQPSSRV